MGRDSEESENDRTSIGSSEEGKKKEKGRKYGDRIEGMGKIL